MQPRAMAGTLLRVMPSAAFALFALFVGVSIVAGLIAWRIIVPAHRWGWIAPILFSFGALYAGGHRLGLEAGPMVDLFGFQVSLLSDLVLAAVAAFVGAIAWRLLGPGEQ